MRISAKSRYAVAAMVYLAQRYASGEYITVIYISERLKISKIYLEQVFSLLKRADIVVSVKGAQGGYRLNKRPEDISVYNILLAVETPLFEKTADTVAASEASIENAMRKKVYDRLDECVKDTLLTVTLEDMANEAEKQLTAEGYMFYL